VSLSTVNRAHTRCAGGIFQRRAVFSRRTSALLHLIICPPNQMGESESPGQETKHCTNRTHPLSPQKSRFKRVWRRYNITIWTWGQWIGRTMAPSSRRPRVRSAPAIGTGENSDGARHPIHDHRRALYYDVPGDDRRRRHEDPLLDYWRPLHNDRGPFDHPPLYDRRSLDHGSPLNDRPALNGRRYYDRVP
jgi:hypothetical protein